METVAISQNKWNKTMSIKWQKQKMDKTSQQ